ERVTNNGDERTLASLYPSRVFVTPISSPLSVTFISSPFPMTDHTVTLLACGDVGPIHEPVGAYSELAKPVLAAADIRVAQVERVYSERGALQVHSGGGHSRAKPHMASVFGDCGFDVVSLASNHAMDWGEDALLDTAALFRSLGIAAVGAGRN